MGVLGIILPPSIVGAAAVGGVAGGVIGHLWRGMSRGDVKELGETLDAGQSALIVIGEDRLADVIDAARLRAVRQVEKELRVLAVSPTHLSLGEVGEALHISRHTVRSHLRSICRKLDAAGRSDAVDDRARRHGLLGRGG